MLNNSQFPLLLCAMFFVLGCHHAPTKTVSANCAKGEIQKIADDLMNKKRYQLSTLNRTISETAENYVVTYEPNNTRVDSNGNLIIVAKGGGATITIAKTNCEVVDMQRYQ